MTTAAISVLLADDHEMLRESLAAKLDERDGLTVVGQANGGHEAVRLSEELAPDVLVLDFGMKDLNGAGVILKLKALGSPTRIVILSHHESIHYAIKTLDAGALGYVIKTSGLDELDVAIRKVAAGDRYICRSLDDAVADSIGITRGKNGIDGLSQREFELLVRMGDGMTIQDAASQMHVSESTASTYRARLMKKLSLKSTAEIIRFAIEHNVSSTGRATGINGDDSPPDTAAAD